MIDKSDKIISISKQCKLLNVNRSTYYYDKKGESADNLKYMRLIDEIYLNKPYFGSRGITRYLKRLSNTMDVSFCKEALIEALNKHNKPEIFNTDQGSQFTNIEFTETLINNDITISMDGKGIFKDNIFIERFWRTLKYEEVYLKAYDTVSEATLNIGNYIWEYNNDRPHSSIGDLPPSEVYFRRELSIQNSLC